MPPEVLLNGANKLYAYTYSRTSRDLPWQPPHRLQQLLCGGHLRKSLQALRQKYLVREDFTLPVKNPVPRTLLGQLSLLVSRASQ
jgi:hypothetical protein